MERATNRSRREEVQKIILALLVCQKNAIAITSLEDEYMEQEGERVPWRSLGHVSFLDFLQSMPDLLIEWRNNEYFARSVPTKKSAHVSSLVARQRISSKKVVGIRKIRPSHYYPKTDGPKVRLSAERLSSVVKLVKQNPKGISKDYLLMTINKEYPYVNICLQDFEDQLRQLSHKVTMQDNLVFPVANDEEECQDVKPNLAQQSKDASQRCTPPCKYYMSDGEDYSDDYDSDDNVFSKFTQNKSQSGAIPAIENKTTSSFPQEGTTKDWRELDNRTDSCNSYRAECGSAKNNFSYDDVRENDNDGVNCLGDGNMQVLINDRVKFRLEKLIQKYPNGIWCAELPQKYLEEYNMDLKYTELGFNSVREFASHLRDIFHCMRPWPNSDYILYNAKDEAPDNSKKRENSMALAELHNMQFEDDIEAMPAIVSLDTSKKLIPESVMTIGEMVSQMSVESLINGTKLFVEVYVVEVFTPSFFWIQLRKNKKSFVQFMTELHEFYTDQCKHYAIPPVVLEKGLNCACIYEGVWHRGIIKSVKPDLQVTVLFYDYGTLKTYPASSIYYLDRKFSFLPAQAIPCGLINTRPISGTEWSQSITHKFAVKTYQIPLIATIGSVDVENNSMMVTLTNTLEDEDVHINDWLVEQNLAVHGTMVRMRCRNFLFRCYVKCRELLNECAQKSEPCLKNASNMSKFSAEVVREKIALCDSRTILKSAQIPNNDRSRRVDAHCSIESRSKSRLDECSAHVVESETNADKLNRVPDGERASTNTVFAPFAPKELVVLYEKVMSLNNMKKFVGTRSATERNKMLTERNVMETCDGSNSPVEVQRIQCCIKEESNKSASSVVNELAKRELRRRVSDDTSVNSLQGFTYRKYDNHFGQFKRERNRMAPINWSDACSNVPPVKPDRLFPGQSRLRETASDTVGETCNTPSSANPLPLVSPYFSNVIRHLHSEGEVVRRRPEGNISESRNVSKLVLARKKKYFQKKDRVIGMPQAMLSVLRGTPLPEADVLGNEMLNTCGAQKLKDQDEKMAIAKRDEAMTAVSESKHDIDDVARYVSKHEDKLSECGSHRQEEIDVKEHETVRTSSDVIPKPLSRSTSSDNALSSSDGSVDHTKKCESSLDVNQENPQIREGQSVAKALDIENLNKFKLWLEDMPVSNETSTDRIVDVDTKSASCLTSWSSRALKIMELNMSRQSLELDSDDLTTTQKLESSDKEALDTIEAKEEFHIVAETEETAEEVRSSDQSAISDKNDAPENVDNNETDKDEETISTTALVPAYAPLFNDADIDAESDDTWDVYV